MQSEMCHFIFKSRTGCEKYAHKISRDTRAGQIPLPWAVGSLLAVQRASGHFPHPWEVGTTDQVFRNNPVTCCAFHWNLSPLWATIPVLQSYISVLCSWSLIQFQSHTSHAHQERAWQFHHPQDALVDPKSSVCDGDQSLSSSHRMEYERKREKTHLTKEPTLCMWNLPDPKSAFPQGCVLLLLEQL